MVLGNSDEFIFDICARTAKKDNLKPSFVKMMQA